MYFSSYYSIVYNTFPEHVKSIELGVHIAGTEGP
jgi:hypothetical protein